MPSAELGVLQRETGGTRNVKGSFTMEHRCESEKVHGGHCAGTLSGAHTLGWGQSPCDMEEATAWRLHAQIS